MYVYPCTNEAPVKRDTKINSKINLLLLLISEVHLINFWILTINIRLSVPDFTRYDDRTNYNIIYRQNLTVMTNIMRTNSPLHGSFLTKNSSSATQPPPTRTMTVDRKIRTRRNFWLSPNCKNKKNRMIIKYYKQKKSISSINVSDKRIFFWGAELLPKKIVIFNVTQT